MSEKRFEPTEKKIKKARKNGNTPLSQLSQNLLVFAVVATYVYLSAEYIYSVCKYIIDSQFYQFNLAQIFVVIFHIFFVVVIGAFCAGAILLILCTIIQIGVKAEAQLITPKASKLKLDLKKLFNNINQYARKFSLMLLILCFNVILEYKDIISLMFDIFLDWNIKVALVVTIMNRCFRNFILTLILIAVIDIFFSRYKYKKSLLMSLQELKDEYKEDEVNPQLKAMRHSVYKKLMREELIERVCQSKVIFVKKS